MTIDNKLLKILRFNHTIAYQVLRIIIGVVIIVEGFLFVSNHELLYQIVQNSRLGGFAFILEHHIVFTLIGGGLFIAMGLLTRIAVLFQLPVFLGVIFNQHATFGLYSVYGNLLFSIVITLGLFVLLAGGSGTYSLDKMMKKKDK